MPQQPVEPVADVEFVIDVPRRRVFGDSVLQILWDDQLMGDGPIKQGFHLRGSSTIGRHKLKAKTGSHQSKSVYVDLDAPGKYVITLDYEAANARIYSAKVRSQEPGATAVDAVKPSSKDAPGCMAVLGWRLLRLACAIGLGYLGAWLYQTDFGLGVLDSVLDFLAVVIFVVDALLVFSVFAGLDGSRRRK